MSILSNNIMNSNHGHGASQSEELAALEQRKMAFKEKVLLLRAKKEQQRQQLEQASSGEEDETTRRMLKTERNCCSLASNKERLASFHQPAIRIQRSKALIASSKSRSLPSEERQEKCYDDDGGAAVPDSRSFTFKSKLEQLQEGLMRMKRENDSVKKALDQLSWILEDEEDDTDTVVDTVPSSDADAEEEVLTGGSKEISATHSTLINNQARRAVLQRAIEKTASERHLLGVDILKNHLGSTTIQEDKTDRRPAWFRSQSETCINIVASQSEPHKRSPSPLLDQTDDESCGDADNEESRYGIIYAIDTCSSSIITREASVWEAMA
jgi:hypothetical protein